MMRNVKRAVFLSAAVHALSLTSIENKPHISFRKKGRNAYYNPLTHRIVVSDSVLTQLDDRFIETMAAHEVCHVTQRSQITRLFLGGMVPLLLAIFSLLSWVPLYWYGADRIWLVLSFALFALLVLFSVCVTFPRFDRQRERDEIEADFFACKIQNDKTAMTRLLHELSEIENEPLSGLAIKRIRAAQDFDFCKSTP